MKLGEVIYGYRADHNLSMREFSRLCKLSPAQVYFMERGTNSHGKPFIPTTDSLIKVAAAVRKYFVKFGVERRGNTEFMHDPTKTPNWNGGIHVKSTGYVEVYAPDHPRANGRPYIYQHILVMEKHIGRYLEKDEVVHHIDGNKSNNDISNLRLMTNREHVMMHGNIGKRKKGGGEPNEK